MKPERDPVVNEESDQQREPEAPEPAKPSARIESSPDSRQSGGSGGQSRGEKQPGRGKRGGGSRGKHLYTFADGLEHCYCRNAMRVPPETFPVTGRTGVATPAMVELARNDKVVLLCDLLHEGPHMWPDGEQFVAEEPS
jgi:hypothetical protein